MNTTTIILIAVIVGLGGWDVFALVKWGYTATISYDVLTDSKNHPIIAVLVGIVIGHLFWPQ